jgi:enoyl-CoA hydratase
MAYNCIIVETRGKVGLIRLNRPKQLNALNDELMNELGDALMAFETDEKIGAIVITGSDKAFAAGADVAEMKDNSFAYAYNTNFVTRNWDRISECRKPVIAAVAGHALGGGCEIALACDFIIAADNAVFGQPEVKLPFIPGAGGTQRLPKLIGKARAMEMCLTGRTISAAEGDRIGLVCRVVPVAELVEQAVATAAVIASYSRPVVMMIKECVNRAAEMPLAEGLLFERRAIHSAFALRDQKEGMNAFLAKRTPTFDTQEARSVTEPRSITNSRSINPAECV